MDYYEMIMRTVFISFGIVAALSIISSIIVNMYIEKTEKNWLRIVLRLENVVLNVIALTVVFILTEGSPVALKISMIFGTVACICIDMVFCKSSWILNWIMPEVDELK